MKRQEFIDLLNKTFRDNGLSDFLNEEKTDKMYRLYAFLIETNKITNLTAITEPADVILKHFADSATVVKHIPEHAAVLDVGCGAGFPSLPIAILRPDVTAVGLDSTGKKVNFVNEAAAKLSLSNLSAVCARAEDYIATHREFFDICTSRAVARLNVLAELCLPFVRVGGLFLPMKAANKGNEEFTEAETGIQKLGGMAITLDRVRLTCENAFIEREIYCIKKTSKSPDRYPRKYAQILKKPL